MTKEFHAAIRQLAQAVLICVNGSSDTAGYETALLDVRYADDGSSWDEKLHVTVPRRALVSVPSSIDIGVALLLLNGMRTALGREWFSLKLTIDSRGEVTIDYGYDTGAMDDPEFFRT